jgi:predicted DCC family thiol-disulfide oxidoreductase YuxK
MPEVGRHPFSHRDDASVPAFDDARPLFVFDGTCVLCSGGAGWLMRHDRQGRINFAPASGTLGQALCRHYGVDADATYLLVAGGRGFTESRGYLELCASLGGAWHLLRAAAVVPEGWRDRLYRLVARNRYRWFGRAEQCALLTPEQRARLL